MVVTTAYFIYSLTLGFYSWWLYLGFTIHKSTVEFICEDYLRELMENQGNVNFWTGLQKYAITVALYCSKVKRVSPQSMNHILQQCIQIWVCFGSKPHTCAVFSPKHTETKHLTSDAFTQLTLQTWCQSHTHMFTEQPRQFFMIFKTFLQLTNKKTSDSK